VSEKGNFHRAAENKGELGRKSRRKEKCPSTVTGERKTVPSLNRSVQEREKGRGSNKGGKGGRSSKRRGKLGRWFETTIGVHQ